MNFVADEGVDKAIVIALRNNGFEVYYIAEEDSGINDEVVLDKSNKLEAILVTADKDFGELVFNKHLASNGVILTRMEGLTQKEKVEIILHTIKKHQKELFRSFTVITKSHIRIRKLYN